MNSIEGDAMKWQFCSVSFNARLQNPEIKFVSAPISKIYIVRLDHGDGRAQWPWEGREAAGRVEWAQQVSEGEAAAGLTLSLNQNHRNFGAWQKSFQTDQGTDLDSWGLGVQGLKVICRLTCMRDSCSVDGTCQKPPPGHHCSEVQKGPPPTQNGRQRAQPPLTEGTRATKLHHHQTSLDTISTNIEQEQQRQSPPWHPEASVELVHCTAAPRLSVLRVVRQKWDYTDQIGCKLSWNGETNKSSTLTGLRTPKDYIYKESA